MKQILFSFLESLRLGSICFCILVFVNMWVAWRQGAQCGQCKHCMCIFLYLYSWCYFCICIFVFALVFRICIRIFVFISAMLSARWRRCESSGGEVPRGGVRAALYSYCSLHAYRCPITPNHPPHRLAHTQEYILVYHKNFSQPRKHMFRF